jgi:hypothetical protein
METPGKPGSRRNGSGPQTGRACSSTSRRTHDAITSLVRCWTPATPRSRSIRCSWCRRSGTTSRCSPSRTCQRPRFGTSSAPRSSPTSVLGWPAVPAWTWTMGSPLVSGRAALLDTSPDKPFHRLLDTVRTAVGDAFEPAPVSYDTSPAHIDTVLSPYRRRFHSRPGDTAEASAGASQSCADACRQGAARGRPAGRRAGVLLVGTRAHVAARGTGMIARSAVYG